MVEQSGVARQLADDLWLIDTQFQGERDIIASYLLVGHQGLALVDVGSAASINELLAGVRAAGFDPKDITQLLLTHVHLDHAGASGPLVRLLPQARVYVHRIGAPHLIDPSKLIDSATRIYGDQMETLWGRMEPVPADRLVVVDDGDEIIAGTRTLRVLYTPGHAIHHVALYDEEHGIAFPGDVAGVSIEGVGFVRPPTPPPDLSLEDWDASITRLESLALERLYLPHFGEVRSTAQHFAILRSRLHEWGEIALASLRAGDDAASIAAKFARVADPDIASHARKREEAPEAVHHYELATNYLMSAQGYIRYYRKHHPELLG
ncbi:MAG TPA: MBL fold metallo-hydrolase [Ktedonobacterales bacterium]|nr:MBL fold metallo-hydrolase [Ktedonobacterales bacterium]